MGGSSIVTETGGHWTTLGAKEQDKDKKTKCYSNVGLA